jgi:DNA mismatch repair ATPase MutS
MLANKTVERYHQLVTDNGIMDSVLCFQCGIFFYIIGKDAERLAPICGLKMLENEMDVYIGFPASALDKYVGRIILNRYDVAVFGKLQSFSQQEGFLIKAKVERVSDGCQIS